MLLQSADGLGSSPSRGIFISANSADGLGSVPSRGVFVSIFYAQSLLVVPSSTQIAECDRRGDYTHGAAGGDNLRDSIIGSISTHS